LVVALAKLSGSVDHRLRPLVRLRFVGCEDDVLATVDTGFNGQLMMILGDARRLGVSMHKDAEEVELGHGEKISVQLGTARIAWLERERAVAVLVSQRSEPTRDGEPVVLIGTRLLTPHLLLVDFEARTVEIETQ
jgi:predicted aspartyl protease